MADLQAREAVREDMLFGIGSITKTFIAVVILRLMEERHLRLEDTAHGILGAAVDGIANSDRAPIAELLNPTSGVPSREDVATWVREGRGSAVNVHQVWGKDATHVYIRGHAALAGPADDKGILT